MIVETSRLRELTRRQGLRLLASVPVGRVGLSVNALPAILPVNYRVIDERIVFRTMSGTKLDAATVHTVVAFEADDYSRDGAWGWSVMVQGIAEEITAPYELEAASSALLQAWAFRPGVTSRFVRIETTFMSGRGFGAAIRALAPEDDDRLPAGTG